MKNRDFVSQYEKIRGLLREIFVYGCFNVDDFIDKGISKSKYNQDIRKILNSIDPNVIENQRINNKKAYYFRINMFETSGNVLFDSFMLKSFTNQEIELSLKIMQLLTASKDPLTQKEIEERLDAFFLESGGSDIHLTDSTTLYRRLKDLENSSFLKKSKSHIYKYSLSEDCFYHLNEDEFYHLITAIDFMRNVQYPSSCGNFLHDTLIRYAQKKWDRIPVNILLFKHNHFAHILDDEILWSLLLAISKNEEVKFHVEGKNGKEIYKRIRPLAIFADEQYGRRYLMAGIDASISQTRIFRLDKISDIKRSRPANKWDAESQANAVIAQKRHSLTGGCDHLGKKAIKVGLIIENVVSERMQIEVNDLIVAVQTIDENHTRLELEVNQAEELKPWLRRYTGKILIEESNEHKLKEIMDAELTEWKACYGLI
ncbi:MAG: hypothetical protein PWP16_818 [Eubacteriaceae bacterium]|nr:hypothetical protein [Eubacteriaceae bacterium]MDK2905185.1 hypothetical protein [Eubacteriaceae bacterium]MDK2937450.1 hypothetical protein [Eubacteriaceae bacterium]MDK2961583.1 hypothetical protein [Eubacteriaceae bacterium]MDN5307455.1 hypothetical protein [Eubacteriaceae bacterium]